MFREFDENGDIKAGTFVTKQDAVGENVGTQIQLWFRENPMDLNEGIDWRKELSDFNEGRLSAQIRDIAFKCKNVLKVSKNIEFSEPENRQITMTLFITTTYSDDKIKVAIDA